MPTIKKPNFFTMLKFRFKERFSKKHSVEMESI